MESEPMKASELGRYVCVAHGGCLHASRTISTDGVWVRSPGPDPLHPGSHVYSSAHRDCYERWAASEQQAGEARAIVHRFGVQPGLWLAVEDSHCLLLQITTPDGATEIARSGALSDGDDIARAVELARVWVAAEADADRVRRMQQLARRRT